MGNTAVLCGAHKRHFISVAVIVPVKGRFSTTVPISGGARRGGDEVDGLYIIIRLLPLLFVIQIRKDVTV